MLIYKRGAGGAKAWGPPPEGRDSTRRRRGSAALPTPDLRLLGSKGEDNTFLLPKATRFVVFLSQQFQEMQAGYAPTLGSVF